MQLCRRGNLGVCCTEVPQTLSAARMLRGEREAGASTSVRDTLQLCRRGNLGGVLQRAASDAQRCAMGLKGDGGGCMRECEGISAAVPVGRPVGVLH